MAALSERQIAIVRTLVESAPDKVVGGLQQALASTSRESALGGVRDMVDAEVSDRTLRNAILQPVAPMCVGAGDSARALTFPSRALGLVWRGLCGSQADRVEAARAAIEEDAPAQLAFAAQDHLTAAAAAGLRERSTPDFAAAADLCDAARPGGAELLAACLDLGPVVRPATQRLAEWIAHPGGDTSASARLAYKDAVAVADDAGQRFFHMLAAQMAQPWMVLRVISAVMDKPTERYLADSELAGFGETLMDEIDRSLDSIAHLNADCGAPAAREAAKVADLVVHQVLELETCLDMQRDHGWGLRVVKQRARLASVVEGRLHEAEKAAIDALPMHTPRHLRARRPVPRLNAAPDAKLVARATALLSFCEELRTTANYGGFSSTRAKVVEKLGEYIDTYVDEVVDLIRTDEAESLEAAQAYLETAARFNRLVRDEKAGDLVRRRAHAALHPEASTGSAG